MLMMLSIFGVKSVTTKARSQILQHLVTKYAQFRWQHMLLLCDSLQTFRRITEQINLFLSDNFRNLNNNICNVPSTFIARFVYGLFPRTILESWAIFLHRTYVDRFSSSQLSWRVCRIAVKKETPSFVFVFKGFMPVDTNTLHRFAAIWKVRKNL
jgi:hypothetical protein